MSEGMPGPLERKGAIVREKWVTARVLGVSDQGNVMAEALRGALDEDGHKHVVLEGRMRGRTWR